MGLFRTFLPAPQICKPIFQSAPRFFSGTGGVPMPFLAPKPFFSRMRRHLLRGCRCFHASPCTFYFIRMPTQLPALCHKALHRHFYSSAAPTSTPTPGSVNGAGRRLTKYCVGRPTLCKRGHNRSGILVPSVQIAGQTPLPWGILALTSIRPYRQPTSFFVIKHLFLSRISRWNMVYENDN